MFVGGLCYRRQLKVQAKGFVRTKGQVTDNVAASEGFRAVVEYSVNGKSFSMTSAVERNPKQKLGSRLAVMHNPAKPSEAFVVGEYYLVANGLLGIGSIFILLGSLFSYYFVFSGGR